MIFLDTNVIIYAFDPDSPFYPWARDIIATAVSGSGAAINAVSLAEICVGDSEPITVADRVRRWGVGILDVPCAISDIAAAAYRLYLDTRKVEAQQAVPRTPLPDFFIGAHAQAMGWTLATADKDRFRTYFPSVTLCTPS